MSIEETDSGVEMTTGEFGTDGSEGTESDPGTTDEEISGKRVDELDYDQIVTLLTTHDQETDQDLLAQIAMMMETPGLSHKDRKILSSILLDLSDAHADQRDAAPGLEGFRKVNLMRQMFNARALYARGGRSELRGSKRLEALGNRLKKGLEIKDNGSESGDEQESDNPLVNTALTLAKLGKAHVAETVNHNAALEQLPTAQQLLEDIPLGWKAVFYDRRVVFFAGTLAAATVILGFQNLQDSSEPASVATQTASVPAQPVSTLQTANPVANAQPAPSASSTHAGVLPATQDTD